MEKNTEAQLANQYIARIKEIINKKLKQKGEIANQYKKNILELKIPELSSFFLIEFHKYLDIETYCQLEKNVITNGTLDLALELSQKTEIKNAMYELELRILDSKNAKQMYQFLISNQSPHKKEIEEKLHETESSEFNCKYAQHLLNEVKDIIQSNIDESNKSNVQKVKDNADSKKIVREKLDEIAKCEQVVLKSQDPKWICELGISLLEENYKNNIEEYINTIIKCKNAQYIYNILKKVNEKAPEIDITKYKKSIIELGVLKLIYRMSQLLDNKQNPDLEDAILDSNDIIMIFIYAKNISNIDIDFFTKKIIETNNYRLMIKYAKEVLAPKKESINDIQEKIIKSKNTELIILFASEVKCADIYKCFETIFKSKNIEIICKFAKEYPEIDEKKLSVIVKNKNDASWSFGFINNFPKIDFEIHRQIILNSRNAKWNYEIAKHFPDINIKEHEEIVIKSNEKKYIDLFSRIPGSTIVIEQPVKSQHRDTKFVKPINDKTTLEDFDRIWAIGSIEWIIAFAIKFHKEKFMIKKISRKIIDKNIPKWSWEFVQRFGIDIEEHKKIICNTPYEDKYERRFKQSDKSSPKQKNKKKK